MNEKFQPVRGTQDLLPDLKNTFRYIESVCRLTAALFGFKDIDTPIFEFSDVFHRTLGETSDAISKETYTFTDRGGNSLTLRPEGTAGLVRAFISNGMTQDLPLRLYYYGPMFRYERPQKGRYRQFHQVGVETLGLESPHADSEVIALAHLFLQRLGVAEAAKLELNSLGDADSRAAYRERLVEFLNDFATQLSPDSQERLSKNPLRILDSKDEGDRKILERAPKLSESLTSGSVEFFGRLQEDLKILGIPFVLNEKLVRGLDYYRHTVFEFTTDQLGAQGALVAGGRYDGLVESMGGPSTPGVGWAAGVERLALLVEGRVPAEPVNRVAIIPADETAAKIGLKMAFDLRTAGIACELLEPGNIGKRLKRANKIGARAAVILGEAELAQQTATVKDLTASAQETVPAAALTAHVQKLFS